MTLAERLREALATSGNGGMLAGDSTLVATDRAMVPAAVLIAVTDRPRPGVILTQRTETLRRHPGQVAFPGGRADPEDRDSAATALREAEEEIALPRDAVEIVCAIDPYVTGTGYLVTPVLGVVPPDLPLVPAEAEVASVFEVPLDFALDAANHLEAETIWQGAPRRYYEILWEERRIWGATAGMIVNLSRRLRWTL